LIAAALVIAALSPAAHASDRIAIGDSVMLGARSALKSAGFGVVDAVTSRQSYSGPALLRKRGSALPRNVVIHLGTNGTFPLEVCKRMVDIAGPDRVVYLVTVKARRSWEQSNNRTIRKCAKSYAEGRVVVVDWHWAATRHRSWLYRDGIHLQGRGAREYARIISDAISARG
jgi:hypothetical protein